MTTLHFGVVDVPYQRSLTPQEARRERWLRKKAPWQSLSGTQTTGEVASILERRYTLFSFYWERHKDEIVEQLTDAMAGKLENAMMGHASNQPLFSPGDLSAIETGFREMIDNRELDGQVAGVPTQAAQRGVNHRLQHPYAAKNPERPSFWDTGLLSKSFRAWVEE